ncbi:hypothetical protein [Quadrisphaera sp. INWT6]|uniref:hypothetical protein n=1 Tax=Quadrisphaera sp. INWT6 TaxID=2596917 RepID=UPI0018927F87|nr:hypothetical protein [Quadrisphaera sp. INWT6]MBF5082771.1 hypothetical protein [Quadrisphaera sp. INWT6]
MDVVEVLRRASDVVERAGVPADLRPVAFSTAVDLLMKDPSAASRPIAPSLPAPQRSREPEPREALDLEDEEPAEEVPAASVSRLGARPSHRPVDRPLDRPAPFQGFGARSSGRSDRLVSVGPTRGPAPAGDDPWGHIADALGVRPELLDRVWEERGGRLQLAGDPSRLGRTRAQRVGTAAVLLLAALRWSGQDGGEPVPDAVVRAEVERLGLLDTGNYTKHLAGRRHLLSVSGSGRTATYKLRYDGLEEARAVAQALLED